MNANDLADQLLNLADEKERRAFLVVHRRELGLECFEKLKARSDARLLEHPNQALNIAEVALQAASFAFTPLAEAVARWARGNALVYLGRYEGAHQDFSRACAMFCEEDKDKLAVARLQTNMVVTLKHLGRYDESLEMANIARKALQPWHQSRYMGTLEMNVGSLYRLTGHYDEALAAYERGRAIFVAQGNRVQAARMDINCARVLVCMDRFDEAKVLLRESSSTLVEEDKPLPAARAHLNLATLLSRQGRHRQALETYAQVRHSFDELDAETEVAVTDLYRTFDYLALNLLPEALELAAEMQDFFERQTMPRYAALAAGNRGVAARKMGHYSEALNALSSARMIFSERGAMAEIALLDLEHATCIHKMGDAQAAVAVVTEAAQVLIDLVLPLQAARARLILADCLLALRELDKAASLYLLALEAIGEMPSLAWQAHHGLGRVAEAHGQPRKALHHYRQAIACIETIEEELGTDEFQAGFLDDKLEVYQRAVRAALALGDWETAFSHAEQSKTGVWRDFIAHEEARDKRQTRLYTLRQEWRWLYSRLTRLDEDEEVMRGGEAEEARWARLRALERQITQVRRDSSQVLRRQSGLSLSAAQRRVPADTLLLDYYCTTDALIVFLINAAGVQVFEHLASLETVERAISRWRFNVESVRFATLDSQHLPLAGLTDEAQDVLYALYRLLIEPLEPHLVGHKSLWVVPHGLLWAVPYAALYNGQRYLVEEFELTCLPGLSASEKDTQCDTPTLFDAPLIVGYSEGGRLAHTVSEAQTVATVLGGGELLLEDEATTERLRTAMSSCTLLHLATHSFFRADAPRFSALHLADGWLTAGDLEEWTLPRARLVTLSACETGLIFSQGSDILGLPRELFRAGAGQLLVSLWAVDDVSTAELMTHFYRALQEGKKVAASLQAAQAAALEKYRHPFHWAGFEMMALI